MTSSLLVRSEYFDLSFSSEPASSYYLLVEVDGIPINVGWFHDHKRLITGFASYELESGNLSTGLQKLLNKHSFLVGDFKECIVSYRTGNYTLIPRTPERINKRTIFSITNKINDDHQLLEHHLINLPAVVLFAIDPEYESAIRKSFFNVRLIPHVAPRIESTLNKLKHDKSSSIILVNAQNEMLDITVFKNGSLILCNSYFQTGKEDIAYYAMYCAEVCDLDSDTCNMILSGADASANDFQTLIQSYWKNISFENPLPELQVSERIADRPKGCFDHITHHLLCAS